MPNPLSEPKDSVLQFRVLRSCCFTTHKLRLTSELIVWCGSVLQSLEPILVELRAPFVLWHAT